MDKQFLVLYIELFNLCYKYLKYSKNCYTEIGVPQMSDTGSMSSLSEELENEIRDALKSFTDMCQERNQGKAAVYSFGHMVVEILNEMSAAKQAQAIDVLTLHLMELKMAPEPE